MGWIGRHKFLSVLIVGAVLVLGAGALGSADEDGDGNMSLGEAFCAEMEAGSTPFAVWQSAGGQEYMAPEDFAARSYVWADRDCPGELASNGPLRTFLTDWGFDPDA